MSTAGAGGRGGGGSGGQQDQSAWQIIRNQWNSANVGSSTGTSVSLRQLLLSERVFLQQLRASLLQREELVEARLRELEMTASGVDTSGCGVSRDQGDEEAEDQTSRIRVMVTRKHDGSMMCFRMRRNTQLRKLMEAYCYKSGADVKNCVFLFDGVMVLPNQTPDELKLEDGDEIEAMFRQRGGMLH